MLRSAWFLAAGLLLVVACVPPDGAPRPVPPPVGADDPLGGPDSPPLVPQKEVRKRHQAPAPPYPAGARAKGIQGDVLVEVWIDAEGKPFRSTALVGPPELLQCAADYVLTWTFSPYLSHGQAIPVRFRLLMPFQLRDGGPYQAIPRNLAY